MRSILFILTAFVASNAISQGSNFNTQRNWSKNKKEIFIGGGATQFLGDLGGRDQVGTDYSLVDMDFPSTGFNIVAGYRFRWHPYWATKSQISFGIVRGSDEHTQDIVRNSRNLSFRAPIVDFQQRIEFIIFAQEKVGSRYFLAGTQGTRMQEKSNQIYLFTGAGVTYFNPQGLYNGSWVNLRPLNTEGQGLPDGPEKYLPVTATIPLGIGFRWTLNSTWRMGVEATYMKTFTDYMDDVSGSYYVKPGASQEEIYLGNPAIANQSWFGHGMQRGDDNLDAYFYVNFVFSKNITYKNMYKKGKSYRFRGAKAKF